jgi:hypothetical protein
VVTTHTARLAEAKWPRWAWFVYPALAIAIGGGLGAIVGFARQEYEPRPARAAVVKPVIATPQPVVATPAPIADSTPPPEIEVEPALTIKASDPAPRLAPKPKARPKPTKSTSCNVYDHMSGC